MVDSATICSASFGCRFDAKQWSVARSEEVAEHSNGKVLSFRKPLVCEIPSGLLLAVLKLYLRMTCFGCLSTNGKSSPETSDNFLELCECGLR